MNSQKNLNTNWRKVASTIYRKPTDSKIYGTVDLDVTKLEKFIAQKRKEGIKTTLTYILTLVVGRSIRQEAPELNTFVKRGKIVQREQVDATVSVLLPGGQMGSVKIENADQLTIAELSNEIADKIRDSRKGDENDTMQSKSLLSSIPWPLRNWVFKLYKTITIHWGISLPFIGLDSNSFGSYVISNIGSLGLDTGYGSLLPSSNVSVVFILGSIVKKPVIINDEIVPRRIMALSATLDHRVVDGSHGGIMFRSIKHFIKNPELLESKPDAAK
ncbi:MAG: dehydrogenase [Prolixibacteraceae bacterium]|jgi:pyruvate/2-oxoglutarate dehydrogenase complex dihydrolipoamide acyltransferase (E2) component|nr:dehydrogenase [Prolixibacteraceae bacterium]MBT6763812.1 dehydrogenase [Prolixibacteraceae bacterium]MBT6998366.1 dehydrogenase [Prolixibacteraceae bacterium]MBT7393855.1 dehydrogenase [Prolixibacteraceae bacterium]